MMAFTTHFDEVGRKTYRPTDGLQALLKQDRITRDDLNQFRSSNRVERLMKEVLQERGFERDDNGKWGDWVRKSSKVGVFEWAKASVGLPYVQTKEPLPKKVSVAERVHHAVSAFIMEQGRSPNKLWISNEEFTELTSNVYSTSTYAGVPMKYQGMSVELMSPGTKLFVGIAAGVNADPQKQEGIHTIADWADKHEKDVISDLVGYATAAKAGEALRQIHFGGNQAGKTQAAIAKAYAEGALHGIASVGKPARAKRKAAAPKRKRIVPPSQLKRKLAL